MPTVKLDIPDELLEELKIVSRDLGEKGWEYEAQRRLHKAVQRIPVPEERREITLDAAVDRLVNALEPDHRNLLLQVSQESGRPLASYLMGYIYRAKDQGALIDPIPEMLEQRVEPTPPASATCEWCRETFTPTRVGQRFCPIPKEGHVACSIQAGRAEILAKRAQTQAKISQIPAPPAVAV